MKKSVKFFSSAVLTVAVMLIVMLCASAETSGQCGDSVFWRLDSDSHTLIISGTGEMYDYAESADEVYSFTSPFSSLNFSTLEIADTVTYIGNGAFYNCKGITEVAIPDGVKKIGTHAFCICEGIRKVSIPDSVEKIEDQAFTSCINLKEVHVESLSAYINNGYYNNFCEKNLYVGDTLLTDAVIPDDVQTIPSKAFKFNRNLSSITIPESVKKIEGKAFSMCSSLKSLTFTGAPPQFDKYALYNGRFRVFYPYGISEWKSAVKSRYAGDITWVPYSMGTIRSVKIKSQPSQKVYYQGEKANLDGLVLTAVWSDGLSEDVVPYTLYKCGEIKLSSLSTKENGVKSVTAKYAGKAVKFKLYIHETEVFTEKRAKYPESLHNYKDNLNETKTYKCTDAEKLEVTFSKNTFVEKDGDYIYVNGKKYTGNTLAGQTVTIDGDTLKIKLVSDEYGNFYGYSIDRIVVTKIHHTYKEQVSKASFTAPGYSVGICEICGDNSEKTAIACPKKIALSTTKAVYNGKAVKPGVTVTDTAGREIDSKYYTLSYTNNTKVGSAKAKITFKGRYSGTKTLTFTIVPKPTRFNALMPEKGKAILKWDKVSGVTGYELWYYSTYSKKYVKDGTTAKTSYSFTELASGKTYKVKVRTYKTVDGTKYYSDFSPVKTVTAK